VKLKVSIVVIAVVLGVGFLVISSSGKDAHPHYQLKEFYEVLKTNPQKLDNLFMTIYGNVKEGSIVKKGIQANFIVEKDGLELPVFATGKNLLPDMFKDGAILSMDGVYNREMNQFEADKVLAKCASKYESAAMPANMGK